jgi:hypothetical protein
MRFAAIFAPSVVLQVLFAVFKALFAVFKALFAVS